MITYGWYAAAFANTHGSSSSPRSAATIAACRYAAGSRSWSRRHSVRRERWVRRCAWVWNSAGSLEFGRDPDRKCEACDRSSLTGRCPIGPCKHQASAVRSPAPRIQRIRRRALWPARACGGRRRLVSCARTAMRTTTRRSHADPPSTGGHVITTTPDLDLWDLCRIQLGLRPTRVTPCCGWPLNRAQRIGSLATHRVPAVGTGGRLMCPCPEGPTDELLGPSTILDLPASRRKRRNEACAAVIGSRCALDSGASLSIGCQHRSLRA